MFDEGCRHENTGTAWIPVPETPLMRYAPSRVNGNKSSKTHGVGLYRYCQRCGAVLAKGGIKARKIGFFTTVVGRLRKLGVTEAQRRLISRALFSDEIFTDIASTYFHYQVNRFVEITKARTNLPDREIIKIISSRI